MPARLARMSRGALLALLIWPVPAVPDSLPIPNYPVMEAGLYQPDTRCPAILQADGRLLLLSEPLPGRSAGTPVMILADRIVSGTGHCAGLTIDVLDHNRLNRLPGPATTPLEVLP